MVDGFTFNFANANVFSIGESNGVWNKHSAQSNQDPSGGHSFYIGTGGLTYNLQEVNVAQIGGGTFTVSPGVLSATPLPATLPLFAGGLGLVGFLTGRKKRSARAIAAA
jgi:hypothetical protein